MKKTLGELLRYLAVSLVALVVDLLLFSVCLRLIGFSWSWAAIAGFIVGALAAYFLSIRFAFRNRMLAHSPKVEFLTFAAIGVLGLGITQLVLWVGIERIHANPELSKLSAAGATFLFNYGVRKMALFRNRPISAVGGA